MEVSFQVCLAHSGAHWDKTLGWDVDNRFLSFYLSPAFHSGRHFTHRQNLDIPTVARSHQEIQDLFEHGKTLLGLSQVLGM